MTEGAKAKLELIKKIIGAEELVEYCQHVYDSALDIQEAGNVDAFLKMNYIFAIDAGYGRDAAVRLFKEFLVECFELNKPEELEDNPDEYGLLYEDLQEELEEDFRKLEESERKRYREIPSLAEGIDESRSRRPRLRSTTNYYQGLNTETLMNLTPSQPTADGTFTTKGYNFVLKKPYLFAYSDLESLEMYIDTEEMKNYLLDVRFLNPKTVCFFLAPYSNGEKVNLYYETVKQCVPVKLFNFREPTNDELVGYAREIIDRDYSKFDISDSKIKQAIVSLKNKEAFKGYKSVNVIIENLVLNQLFEQNELAEESASQEEDDRFTKLAKKYHALDDFIKERVCGQDHAVTECMEALFSSDLNENEKRKGPKASFLFMGPPGVGKTLIAKSLGDGLGLPTLILNMSDYSEEKAHVDLVGSSRRFKNGSEGKLVEFVRQNPKSIVVLDEIEKAHLNVIHLFLQVLDMGVLLDAFTEQYLDFSDIIVVFTSNVGRSLYEDDRNRNLARLSKRVLKDAIENEKNNKGAAFFPKAICSRLTAGNVIMFNRMDTKTLLDISTKAMTVAAAKFEKRFGYQFNLDSDISSLFIYQQGNNIDARVASKKSEAFLRKELYEISRLMKDAPELLDGVDSINFRISPDEAKMVKELVGDDVKGKILYVGEPIFNNPLKGNFKVDYVTTLEDVKKALRKEYTFVLIDPYFGIEAGKQVNLSMNDLQSVGINVLHNINNGLLDMPIYIVDKDGSFTDTDEDSFALDGASGCIKAGAGPKEFSNILNGLVRKQNMLNNHEEFCNRGYTLDFSSRQFKEGNQLVVEYYDLEKKMTPDSTSAKVMVSETERPTIHLKDVIGAEEARDELKFFVKYLKDPRKYMEEGQRAPKGLLLYGPPGTGKTMLAKALAGECDAAFISTSAAELLSPLSGEGEAKIKNLFTTARRYAPAIIFIDEIDAIGKMRSGMGTGESLLNVLLTEMDGFKTNPKKPVFVLAATNFGIKGDSTKKIKLDPALLRRFDNKIYVDLPKESERKEFLKLYREKNEGAIYSDEAMDNIAKRSLGRSIAELENILALASRNALRKKSDIDDEVLLDAFEQTLYGLKKEQTEDYYHSTAIHEAGHAYIAHISGNTPTFITITGRADFAGYVAPAVNEDKNSYSEEDFRWLIREKLAGRVAERVLIGGPESVNTGASSDLEQATHLAINMVAKYGFAQEQPLALSAAYIEKFGVPQEYLKLANDIICTEQAACERLIREGQKKILKLANVLVKDNNLMTEGIRKVLDK